jgi:F-type H+-transporting ATPase subunit a
MIKKRYLVLISLLALGAITFWLKPVLPVVQLPGEIVVEWSDIGLGFLDGWFSTGLTNTFIATAITYLLIFAIVLAVRGWSRTADEIPTGFYNFFEMIIEGAYGYVENAAGKWAKNFFPFFMTFILLIILANWLELIPGVDSIGIREDLGHHQVELAEEAAHEEGRELTEEEIHAIEEEALEEGGIFTSFLFFGDSFLVQADEGQAAGQTIVPFVRVPATDLNFTFALALLSVAMTQYFGFKALGAGYLRKFFNFNADKIAKNPLSALDFVVGILELVSEIAKTLSFAFRLFGNIFAGQVLLFVIGFLLPVALFAIYGLEFFVGAIQAVVFGLLTLTFMAGATQHHGDDENH